MTSIESSSSSSASTTISLDDELDPIHQSIKPSNHHQSPTGQSILLLLQSSDPSIHSLLHSHQLQIILLLGLSPVTPTVHHLHYVKHLNLSNTLYPLYLRLMTYIQIDYVLSINLSLQPIVLRLHHHLLFIIIPSQTLSSIQIDLQTSISTLLLVLISQMNLLLITLLSLQSSFLMILNLSHYPSSHPPTAQKTIRSLTCTKIETKNNLQASLIPYHPPNLHLLLIPLHLKQHQTLTKPQLKRIAMVVSWLRWTSRMAQNIPPPRSMLLTNKRIKPQLVPPPNPPPPLPIPDLTALLAPAQSTHTLPRHPTRLFTSEMKAPLTASPML